MSQFKNHSQFNKVFLCAFIALLILNIGTHFWGLSRFNTLVFDETSYPKMAQAYINGSPVDDPHPPLGKYLLALGMKVADYIGPFGVNSNTLTGNIREPWMYRWISALAGILTPFALGWLAWEASHRFRFTLLTILFASLDGLLLVESRYGLINIWLILFGIIGHAFFMKALRSNQSTKTNTYLMLSGIFIGACISVKWTGIAFLATPWFIWLLLKLEKKLVVHQESIANKVHETSEGLKPGGKDKIQIFSYSIHKSQQGLFEKLRLISFTKLFIFLAIIPSAFYVIQWQPHLSINSTSFKQVHQQILSFHKSMKDEHPYCSKWYTWPIMYRPVGYFFGTRKSINDPLPPDVLGSNESGNTVFYDVHGMGNPLLWWASFLALLTLLTSTAINTKALLIPKFSINTSNLKAPAFSLTSKQLGYEQVFVIYLLTAYFGSLLPWVGISRCAFIYSYMPSLIFALLGLAYVVDQLLNFKRWNIVGLLIIAGILFGFYYWLPNFLGLPMTNTEFYSRMWLGSWI